MKTIALVLVAAIIAIAVILPASAAWQDGHGKMCKTGLAPQDGTGNQNGAGQNWQQGGNGTCIHEDCPNNGTPLHNGTGLQYGRNLPV